MSVEYMWVLNEYQKNYARAQTRTIPAGKRVNQIGYQRKIVKGMLDNLVFQVNPTSIDWEEGANWVTTDSPSRYAPFLQAGCNKPKVITFVLHVDEWMFGKPVNAEQTEAELSRMANQHFAVTLVLGKRVENVVVSSYKVTAQSFNPDLSLREFDASLELMVLK